MKKIKSVVQRKLTGAGFLWAMFNRGKRPSTEATSAATDENNTSTHPIQLSASKYISILPGALLYVKSIYQIL